MQLMRREVILSLKGRTTTYIRGMECDEDYLEGGPFSSFGFGVHF